MNSEQKTLKGISIIQANIFHSLHTTIHLFIFAAVIVMLQLHTRTRTTESLAFIIEKSEIVLIATFSNFL